MADLLEIIIIIARGVHQALCVRIVKVFPPQVEEQRAILDLSDKLLDAWHANSLDAATYPELYALALAHAGRVDEAMRRAAETAVSTPELPDSVTAEVDGSFTTEMATEAGTVVKAGATFGEGDVRRPKIANVRLMSRPADDAPSTVTLTKADELIFMGKEQDGFVQVETGKGAGWVKKILVTK